MRDYMRLHKIKLMYLCKKAMFALAILACSSFLLAACSPAKPLPTGPLTKHQRRAIALHMLASEHIAVIHRGNQFDILIPTALLFQRYSTNMSSNAPYILSPLYHAIQTFDVETVQIQGLNNPNPSPDELLLTRARAGIVGHHLWQDGLNRQMPLVYGGLRAQNQPISSMIKDLHAPLIWIHWRYMEMPRMYD